MTTDNLPDFSDLRGLDGVAGSLVDIHGLDRFVLLGPPGVGKTMIARRLTGLLGPLSDLESTWLAADYASLNITLDTERLPRPFRAPHYTISTAAMIGASVTRHAPTCVMERATDVTSIKQLAAKGIRRISCTCGKREHTHRVGEVRLARFGILFLDELTEFSRATIDALATELHRMGSTAPRVIAASTPCPCGWKGSTVRACACTPDMLDRWDARLSSYRNKLMMDEEIHVPSFDLIALRNAAPCRSTAQLRAEMLAKG